MPVYKIVTNTEKIIEIEADNIDYNTDGRMYFLTDKNGAIMATFSAESITALYKKDNERNFDL